MVVGAEREPRRAEAIAAWTVRALRPLEAEAGLVAEEAVARGAAWDTTGNVGRDGSLLGSDRGDAGSPDAEAA